jgi:hypothetical protein
MKKPEYNDMTLEQQIAFGGHKACGARLKIFGVRMEELLYQCGIQEACKLHDFEYLRGKSFFEKLKADFTFWDTLISILHKHGWFWKLPLAGTYFAAVLVGGWGFNFSKRYRTLEEIVMLDELTRWEKGKPNDGLPGVT